MVQQYTPMWSRYGKIAIMVQCLNLGEAFMVALLSMFCRSENFHNKKVKKKVKRNITSFTTHVLFYLGSPDMSLALKYTGLHTSSWCHQADCFFPLLSTHVRPIGFQRESTEQFQITLISFSPQRSISLITLHLVTSAAASTSPIITFITHFLSPKY